MLSIPKLLPWYARQAGVSVSRAEALWPLAVENARKICPSDETSELCGTAMTQLRFLLQQEACKYFFPSVMPLLHSQLALWRLPLTVMENALSTTTVDPAA